MANIDRRDIFYVKFGTRASGRGNSPSSALLPVTSKNAHSPIPVMAKSIKSSKLAHSYESLPKRLAFAKRQGMAYPRELLVSLKVFSIFIPFGREKNYMNAKVFIDTNILVYAYNSDDYEKQNIAAKLLNENLAEEEILRILPISVLTTRKAFTVKETYHYSWWDSLVLASALETIAK
jgi:predicted nucleic acid-binding protein